MLIRNLAGATLAICGLLLSVPADAVDEAAAPAETPAAAALAESTEPAEAAPADAAEPVEAAVPAEAASPADAAAPAEAAEPAQAAEPVAAVAPAPFEPVFTNPKQIETYTGRIEGKEAAVALLPSMQLRWAVRSKATATGGVFRKHRSSKEIFAPFDQERLQRVLVALQDDLEARFEAAGWQALTRDELGGDLPQVKTLKTDAKIGAPMFKYDDSINEQDAVVFALPGADPVDPKAISNGMAFARFLKGKQGVNLNIVYSFAPGTVGETDSRMLGTEAGAGLWFSARADLIGAERGGWGNINVVPAGVVLEGDIGTLAEIEGSRAGAAENIIRFVGGMGGSDRAGFTMTPDWSKAEAAMLRAGMAFNAELVSRLAK